MKKLREKIRFMLIKEGGYYIGKNGEVLQDPGHRYFNQDEPFTPNTKDLSLSALKYHLEDLSPDLKRILYAPDAQILDEPDNPEGIYTVFSKSMSNSFNFSYGNEDSDDWTVFVPEN